MTTPSNDPHGPYCESYRSQVRRMILEDPHLDSRARLMVIEIYETAVYVCVGKREGLIPQRDDYFSLPEQLQMAEKALESVLSKDPQWCEDRSVTVALREQCIAHLTALIQETRS